MEPRIIDQVECDGFPVRVTTILNPEVKRYVSRVRFRNQMTVLLDIEQAERSLRSAHQQALRLLEDEPHRVKSLFEQNISSELLSKSLATQGELPRFVTDQEIEQLFEKGLYTQESPSSNVASVDGKGLSMIMSAPEKREHDPSQSSESIDGKRLSMIINAPSESLESTDGKGLSMIMNAPMSEPAPTVEPSPMFVFNATGDALSEQHVPKPSNKKVEFMLAACNILRHSGSDQMKISLSKEGQLEAKAETFDRQFIFVGIHAEDGPSYFSQRAEKIFRELSRYRSNIGLEKT